MNKNLHHLPAELVSLVQHVKLNEAGWWERGLKRIIIASLWTIGTPTTREDLISYISEDYNITNKDNIDEQISNMLQSKSIIEMPDKSLKLSEEKIDEFGNKVEDHARIEDLAQRKFAEIISNECEGLDPEKVWAMFVDEVLLPMIKEMGARTYEIISTDRSNVTDNVSFESFLSEFNDYEEGKLIRCCLDFLQPDNKYARQYILQYLNVYFFIEASNLSKENINALNKSINKTEKLTIFLDTNVVFSLLGFHNNPSDEDVKSLIETVRNISDPINVQFKVLPTTLDETRRSLDASKASLENIKLPNNLAAATANTSKADGIIKKYATATLQAGRPLKPEDFFGKYLNNILEILRSGGVELHNDRSIEEYSFKQIVIDDIEDQKDFEEERYEQKKRKSHEALKHDITLWHYVRDYRPTRLESPLDASNWVATIDYRLIGFDRHKISQSPGQTPVCVHPGILVQLLQLWVPRDKNLEDAILNSLKLPLIATDFDTDAESITIEILNTLLEYENVDQLDKDTAQRMLANDAVRRKISIAETADEKRDVIETVLMRENQKLVQRANNFKDELDKFKNRIEELETAIKHEQEQESKLERQLENVRTEKEKAEVNAQKLHDKLENKDSTIKLLKGWTTYTILLFIFSLILWLHEYIVGADIIYKSDNPIPISISIQILAIFALLPIPLPKHWKKWLGISVAIILTSLTLW